MQPPRTASQWLGERSFRQRDIPVVREFARTLGARAGMVSGRPSDYVSVESDSDGIWVLLSMAVA